ncbi:MAG: hypothetical protein ACTSRS_21250 [Candidatus Helarchaeota archaeon]
MESLSDKNTIWQLDELLLILLSSGRFHNQEDFRLFSNLFERIFPQDVVIGFKGNATFISRQIESVRKKGLVISVGPNISISAKGRKVALEILNTKILANPGPHQKELITGWKLYRKVLARLPRVKSMWEKYLDAFFTRLNK